MTDIDDVTSAGVFWRSTHPEMHRDVVILLHGIGSSSDSFAYQLGSLGKSYSVHAWDAPGYARSESPSRDLSMAQYAEIVLQRAMTLSAESEGRYFHLVGVSWGGVVALQAVLDYPEVFDSLTMVSSSVGSGTSVEKAAAMRSRPSELEELGVADFARQRAPRLLSPGADHALIDSAISTMTRSIRGPGYRSATQAMAATDHTGRLAEVGTPTLLLAGTADAVTGPAASRRLFDGLPDAAYFPIRGAGHLLNQERPAEFDRILATFIEVTDQNE